MNKAIIVVPNARTAIRLGHVGAVNARYTHPATASSAADPWRNPLTGFCIRPNVKRSRWGFFTLADIVLGVERKATAIIGSMESIRIANCSGFFGDRASAAREMVDGGPIDVLTGDYLAELTMAILARHRMRDPDAGYVPTFLDQLEEVLATCIDKGIKIVANAGGLNPPALAREVAKLADRLGLAVSVAVVTGDDVLPRSGELAHAVTGEAMAGSRRAPR